MVCEIKYTIRPSVSRFLMSLIELITIVSLSTFKKPSVPYLFQELYIMNFLTVLKQKVSFNNKYNDNNVII